MGLSAPHVPAPGLAAQQQDYPVLGELLGVVAQPGANRCQRKLDQQRQGDRFAALARWRGHDVKPDIDDEQRCRSGRGCRQVPGSPEREVAGACQSDQKHDVESRPGDVVARAFSGSSAGATRSSSFPLFRPCAVRQPLNLPPPRLVEDGACGVCGPDHRVADYARGWARALLSGKKAGR
jgi:hypothetical protein